MKILILFFLSIFIFSCSENKDAPKGFSLPDSCNNSCYSVDSQNSFEDSIRNGEKCLCLFGEQKYSMTLGTSVVLIGKDDGSSAVSSDTNAITIKGNDISLYNLNISSKNNGVVIESSKNIYLKNIIIESESGSSLDISKSTQIEGEDLVIIQKTGSSSEAGSFHKAISVKESSEISFSKTVVENLGTDSGAYSLSLFADTVSSLNFSDSTFSGKNSPATLAAEIHNTVVSFKKTIFENYTLQGIVAKNLSKVRIEDSVLREIKTVVSAIYGESAVVEIIKTSIENITKPDFSASPFGGWGIAVKGKTTLLVTSSTIKGSNSSGIIGDSGAFVSLQSSTVSENKMGGLWLQSSSAEIISSILDKNQGVGIYLLNSSALIEKSSINKTGKISFSDTVVGDGVLAVGENLNEYKALSIKESSFSENGRAAIVLDGTDSLKDKKMSGVTLLEISIAADNMADNYAAVIQNGFVDKEVIEKIETPEQIVTSENERFLNVVDERIVF